MYGKNKIFKTMILRFILLLCFFLYSSLTFGTELPLKNKYPSVNTISTNKLHETFDRFLIVDVRSKFEYDVIHIKDAIHISISKVTFSNKLNKVANINKNISIVFYCNGLACGKSYKASLKAKKLGFNNTFVLNVGIFKWTNKYPKKSVLFGENPFSISKLISPAKFKKHSLSKLEFQKKCKSPGVRLFDIRDTIQKAKTPNFPLIASSINVNKFVKNLENPQFRHNLKDRTILFYDAVGKQVRWLQYYLEKNNIKNYFFLDKGVWSIFGADGVMK